MTIFLIALAVGVVAAFVLWKLGQRTPPDPKDRKHRPIAETLWYMGLVAAWLMLVGDNFHKAWTEIGDAISQMSGANADDLALIATDLRHARLELVESTAMTTLLLAGLVLLIFRLIEAIRRHRSDAATKLQETHI